MKLNPFCMCCALNKQEQKIRHYPDMEKKTEYMKKVMALMANTEEKDCAPSLPSISRNFTAASGTVLWKISQKSKKNSISLC